MIRIKALYIGLITAGLMITVSLVSFYALHLPVESNVQFLVYGIFTAGLVWCLLNYFKSAAENKAFKDYFNTGFKVFVLVAFLMAVYAFVFFSLNTGFRDAKIAENNRLILLEGNHLPQEIEENAKQLKKLFMPIMVSSAMFRYLIIGALITAVGAGYLSQKSKEQVK